MRWSTIRLIWVRELRDQLRDRRTVFMIVVLPILLYPILGMGVLSLAMGFLKEQSIIGVYHADRLPHLARDGRQNVGFSPLPVLAWFSAMPAQPGNTPGQLAGAAALARLGELGLGMDYPPLFVPGEKPGRYRFSPHYFENHEFGASFQMQFLEDPPEPATVRQAMAEGINASSAAFLEPLKKKEVDLLVIVAPDFREKLEHDQRAELLVLSRPGDDRSRLVAARLDGVLGQWKKQIKELRLLRRGVPYNFDEVLESQYSGHDKSDKERAADSLFDMMGKLFPFLLVMWSLAGALYPAVDLCAGEKERGTMETLLISPVSREEIVYGKFFAIWVFSGATALLNLLSMGLTTWQFSGQLSVDVVRPVAMLWCVLLVLPFSAFFSALCLAIGAYARSSKEGQYYLMPLFLVTMPLIFLTLAPGVELNPFYSMVPITGVALLLQKLMTGTAGPLTWIYFVPVLAPMILYGWLALRWAVLQFQREEVLFREAERLDIGLWLKRLFRDKESLPSAGQAMFCFFLIVMLRWFSFGIGTGMPLLVRTGVVYLAFVLIPPVLMALQLTQRPRDGLGLRWPPWRAFLVAVALAVLLLPPLAMLTVAILHQFPDLTRLLTERNPLTEELRRVSEGSQVSLWWQLLLVLVIMPALCEELAFRGFILCGLRQRFRTWSAILMSSFLFALFHMNVFQFIPAFLLGVVLAVLAVRTGSVLPGMLFHLLHNALLFLPKADFMAGEVSTGVVVICLILSGACVGMAGLLFWWLTASGLPFSAGGPSPSRELAAPSASREGAGESAAQA